MSSETPNYVQQTIVPAYVMADEDQRQALLVAQLSAAHTRIAQDGLTVRGDAFDSELGMHYLAARVGTSRVGERDVDFVAYEPCAHDEADLVFVTITVQTQHPAST